jgi:hypothetical protein
MGNCRKGGCRTCSNGALMRAGQDFGTLFRAFVIQSVIFLSSIVCILGVCMCKCVRVCEEMDFACVCLCVRFCVCVRNFACVREILHVYKKEFACACENLRVCVCERERERERFCV